ncbi:hypothetical protein MD537_14780 [Flavihumibacter sediminis]|nr:hypothetical protein [Flavihumibacter sediminis]
MAKQQDKITMLKGLLNGSIALTELLPPRRYHVYHHQQIKDGEVISDTYTIDKKVYNPDEYKEWYSHIRDTDVVFMVIYKQDLDAPQLLFADPSTNAIKEAQDARKEAKQGKHKGKAKKATEQAINSLINDTPTDAATIKRTSGLASEYGTTWGNIHADPYYFDYD